MMPVDGWDAPNRALAGPRRGRRVRPWVVAATLTALLGVGVSPSARAADRTASGPASAGVAAQAIDAGTTWAPTVIDPPRGVLQAIDCPTTKTCVAVDNYGNAVLRRSGVWSRAVSVAPSTLFGVSCASSSFCVAIGTNFVSTYDGHVWTRPLAIDHTPRPHLQSVSCPTTTFCVVVNYIGYAFVYRSGTWSPATLVDPLGINSVSCASAKLCMAADAAGRMDRWDGTRWDASVRALNGQQVGLDDELVSCPSTTFCEATSPDRSATWDGKTWTLHKTLVTYPLNLLDNLSCSSRSRCRALDLNGNVWTTANGKSWVKGPSNGFIPATPNESPIRGLACPSATMCVALGTLDEALPDQDAKEFDGTTWSAAAIADPYDAGWLSAISCPTTTACAAIDYQGYAMVEGDGVWSYPVALESREEDVYHAQLIGVGCASPTECVVTVEFGRVSMYDGSSWSPLALIDKTKLAQPACVAGSFCLLEGFKGELYSYNGHAWTRRSPAPGLLAYLTCGSSTFCLGFSSDANDRPEVLTWDGSSWSAPTLLAAATYGISGASCAGPGDCTAVGDVLGGHIALHLHGTTWSAPIALQNAASNISCAPTSACLAVNNQGAETIDGTTAGPWVDFAPFGAEQVSCPTASHCTVTSNGGVTLTPFDPARMCPNAHPTAAELDNVYASVTSADELSATGFTGRETTHVAGTAVTTEYTHDTPDLPDVRDAHGRLQISVAGAVTTRAVLTRTVFTSEVSQAIAHQTHPTRVGAQQNVGLSELGVASTWVTVPEGLSDADLATGLGAWVDPAQVPAAGVVRDRAGLDAGAAYSCSVSGHTQTVSDGTSTWTLTVDDHGRAVGVSIDGHASGVGAYTEAGTASYDGPHPVSVPTAITGTVLDKAIARGLVQRIAPKIAAGAKKRFPRDHHKKARVASLRAAAKAGAAAMLTKYAKGTTLTITRAKVLNGVKVTVTYRDPVFSTHASGYVTMRVKGKHVTSTFHLPT
jgi:hypothetical protein